MSSPMGAPGGIERRALRGLSLVPQALPAKALKQSLEDAVTVRLVQTAFIECTNRRHLVSLLDRQAAISQQVKRPFYFLLCSLQHEEPVAPLRIGNMSSVYNDAVLNVIARIFRSHLRPTDLLVKPNAQTLGVVLLDAEEAGAKIVCKRLFGATSRRLFFGKGSVQVALKFGLSKQVDGFGGAGSSLLTTAERALEKAKASEDIHLVVADAVTGPQKFHDFGVFDASPDSN